MVKEDKYIIGVDPITDNSTSAKVVDGVLQYDIKKHPIDTDAILKHFK